MDKWWRPISPFKLNWYMNKLIENGLNIACLNSGVSTWSCLPLYPVIIALDCSRVNCFGGIWPKKWPLKWPLERVFQIKSSWSWNGREIYLFLRFLISGSVRHYQVRSPRLSPGEFINSKKLSKVALKKVLFFISMTSLL